MEPAAARRWSAAISMLMKWETKKTTKKQNFISMAQISARTSVCGVSSPLCFIFLPCAHANMAQQPQTGKRVGLLVVMGSSCFSLLPATGT